MVLIVEPLFPMDDVRIGDSLSVNGVCLTVTEERGRSVSLDVSAETLARSTLKSVQTGERVNLERALRLSDRLGGHLVAGHVDGVGRIAEKEPRHGSWSLGIDIDPAMFEPAPLHPDVVIGAVDALPYPEACFDLVTCSNLLFLNPHSIRVLRNLQRLLLPGGQLAMINPSEKLSTDAASQLADSAGLTGLARDSLLNFAGRAERHRRWTESETGELIKASGLAIIDTKLTMGPGFARFTRAQKQRSKQYASL